MRMAVAAAAHHSAYKTNAATYVDAHTQTVTFSAAATYAATASPAPAVTYAAPAPMIEYVAPAIPETVNTYVAPAPVIEYIAPSPAVSYPSFYPSFSRPNEAITGLVNPQFPITADETSQVQVVVQEIPEVQVVERTQSKLLSPLKCLHRSVCNSTPLYKLCTSQSLKSRSRVPSPVW